MDDERGIHLDTLLRTDPEIAAVYARSSLRSGDLVISIGPSFGKVMIVPPELTGANLTQGTARIALEEGYHPRFVFWALRSSYCSSQWEAAVGGATFRALNLGPLGETRLPIHSVQRQKAIADYLDQRVGQLDMLLHAKNRLLELLTEKRRALVAHAVMRGLDPSRPLRDSGVAWVGNIPAHWEVERARWLFCERDERSVSGCEELLTVSHITGVTPRAEKDVNMFEAESTEGYKICRCGDLAINTLWAWMGAMGVSWTDGIVSPAYNVYQPCDRIDPDYLDLLVRTPTFAQEVIRHSKGVWSSRLRLYPEGFFEILLPVPPRDEQCRIASTVKVKAAAIQALQSATRRSVGLLQERRTALITAAVTGNIDATQHMAPA